MLYLLIAIAAIIAVLAVAVPIMVIAVVSLGSLREESLHSLGDEAPGAGERVARWILGFHTANIGALAPRRTTGSASTADPEVRFTHARRPLPAAGQLPAQRQSHQDRVGSDQRERAGV